MQILSRQQSRPFTPSVGSLAVLPVFFNLEGKRALVAGGSAAATWKAELLAAAGAEVHVYAQKISEEMSALLAALPLVHHPRDWREAGFDAAAIAVADVETDEEARAFFVAAASVGVPCNVIDRPDFCQFQFGAIVNRSPVVVAISTDGAAPILGQVIRRRIETLLPLSLARWASLAKTVRSAIGKVLAPGAERRRFWEGFADQVFSSNDVPDTETLLTFARTIAEGDHAIGRTVTEMTLLSDDPELLTLKTVRTMQTADAIFFDAGTAPAIIELGRREALKRCLDEDGGHIVDVMSRLEPECRQIVVLRRVAGAAQP